MSDTLPDADQIRSAKEVAERSLALFTIIGLSFGSDRTEISAWLQQNDLWRALSPRELGFIDSPSPSRQVMIDAQWNTEALIVLLWALGLIDKMPRADEQCDPLVFQELLPPYADFGVREFFQAAKLRPENELIAYADECLRLHWEARDAKLRKGAPRVPVDIEIIQERHRAINWVVGYDGAPWDEVTADT